MSEDCTRKDNKDDEQMRPGYDIRGGIRGKYYARYHGLIPVQTIYGSPWIATLPNDSLGEHPLESTQQVGAIRVEQSPEIQGGNSVQVTHR